MENSITLSFDCPLFEITFFDFDFWNSTYFSILIFQFKSHYYPSRLKPNSLDLNLFRYDNITFELPNDILFFGFFKALYKFYYAKPLMNLYSRVFENLKFKKFRRVF